MSAAAMIASSAPLQDDGDRLSVRDYARISALVGNTVGIRLPPGKRVMVEGRLKRRVRALGVGTLKEYCSLLFERDAMDQELPALIDVLTTNKTDFFREPAHFEILAKTLVPTLLSERRGERTPRLKVWSAAASSGAEAYTIAMVLADLAARGRGFDFSVLGTDVCRDVLSVARRAVYPVDMLQPVPKAMRDRFLLRPRDRNVREWRIAPELRRRVRFANLNLMDAEYPIDRDVDVVFLRNVLIYFDREDQAATINKLIGHLRTGGYLILGLSEQMVGDASAVRQLAPAVFQKL